MQQNQAPRIENLLGNKIGKAGRADSLVELGGARRYELFYSPGTNGQTQEKALTDLRLTIDELTTGSPNPDFLTRI